MSKSKVFFILCLCFISGIALHSILSPDKRLLQPFTLYLVFLVLLTVGLITKHGRWVILFFALVILGFFRYTQVLPTINEHNILYYAGQEVTIRGIVVALPRVREKTTAYVIKLKDIQKQSSNIRTALGGKFLISTEHLPAYQYNDLLTIACVPEPLGEYEQYVRRDGIVAACAFPSQIVVVPSLRDGTPSLSDGIRGVLYKIRESFHFRLQALFPDPYGGLLSGLLYGDTNGFSKELKDNFRIAGISHITALSGYNVTIIAQMLIYLLVSLWLTRKQALPIALLLIFGFVILTGAEASVVRAAIMGFLILGAKGIGRISAVRVALTFAGAIMLALNPYLLRYDLGFQLSFLATIALIWLADDFAERTGIRFLPKIFGIREAGAASAAAILFTAPLLFYTTGMIGPLSLLVNILVVPIVPFVMAIGFLAVAVDFLFHPLGLLISWVTRVPLGYIIGVAEYFARFGAWHLKMNFYVALAIFITIVLWMCWWKRREHMAQLSSPLG